MGQVKRRLLVGNIEDVEGSVRGDRLLVSVPPPTGWTRRCPNCEASRTATWLYSVLNSASLRTRSSSSLASSIVDMSTLLLPLVFST